MDRAFVIGNGPSLRRTPLHRLEGEVSFATNRIRLIYPHTSWRPQHYVRTEDVMMAPEMGGKPAERELWHQDIVQHLELPGCHVWCNPMFVNGEPLLVKTGKMLGGVTIIDACAHYNRHFDDPRSPHTWHLPKLCTFGSVITTAIQIAVEAGYGPIYLLGCDLGYKDGESNHFVPEYEDGYERLLRPARMANTDTLAAHMVAARSSPVPIYNATIGGELEVYPRVTLEEVL